MNPLPPSSDVEFWDGDVEVVDKRKTKPKLKHKVIRKYNQWVCISCPYEHTLNVPDGYVIQEGQTVTLSDLEAV